MDGAPYRTYGLSDAPGTLGLSCNKQGLALAGVPLLRQAEHGFAPRSPAEVTRLLSAAYDIDADATSILTGLAVVARALNGGDIVRAMIAAAQLKLPALDWDGAVRIARAAEALEKYSRNQPRDWHGRWTTGGTGGPAMTPQPVSFRPSGQSAEAPPAATPQSDDAAADDPSGFELPKDWVTLPPGKRIDELGDLLEWIANAKPEDEREIRAEIKRYYYDVGDIRGGNALNQALSEALQDGPLSTTEKQEFLKAYEPYTRADPADVAQMLRDLVTLGLTPPIGPVTHLEVAAGREAAAAAEAAAQTVTAEAASTELRFGIVEAAPISAEEAALRVASWKEMGWADRGNFIDARLGRNLLHNFQVLDWFKDGLAISNKSLDLTAATYQSAARLLSRVNRYVDDLANFEGAQLGKCIVTKEEIVTRRVRLAVPRDAITDAQREALQRAIDSAQAKSVDLLVIPF
jgi:contact-dependent growth inhibition (CDI) system restriction endonuclease-like protein